MKKMPKLRKRTYSNSAPPKYKDATYKGFTITFYYKEGWVYSKEKTLNLIGIGATKVDALDDMKTIINRVTKKRKK